jgi:glycosyltransferase involved in cell wall biosynthesis
MRIAYIAPYQGPALMERRPAVWNLSLAARVKVEVIAALLQRSGHQVEVLSQGEVIKRAPRFYPAFTDPEPFDSRIPVFYSSALPVKFLNGLWSGLSLLRTFQARHKIAPYDAVLIYNFKVPQMMCARYASERLALPVILEYEDDAFVNIAGQETTGFRQNRHLSSVRRILSLASAGIGVTPHVLTQMPCSIPKLLLRGVVSDEIANAVKPPVSSRKNWIAFSGTLFRTKGLEQLIEAWGALPPSGWELHIAGDGALGDQLRRMAANKRGIVFHGVLNRSENARLLSSAKIGINPHDLSATPGNVFAFKIIEYLAAGTHVISTPMGTLEPALEAGITYMPANTAGTIAATLRKVIEERHYERTAARAALETYGPEAISKSLDTLVQQAANRTDQRSVSEVKGQRIRSSQVKRVFYEQRKSPRC